MRTRYVQCVALKHGALTTAATSVRSVRLHVGNSALPRFKLLRCGTFGTTRHDYQSHHREVLKFPPNTSHRRIVTLRSNKMSADSKTDAHPTYQALEALVKSAGDDKAIDDTVQRFSELAKASASELEDFLWETYNGIFDVAGQTAPEKQTPLVDFVQRLRETTVTGSDGQALHISDGVVWKDLPTFGWVARDLWNFDVLDASASKEEKTDQDNKAAFLAQLTARASVTSAQRDDPLDYSMYGLWALREAFEEEHPAGADVVSAVRQAYLWIRYAGDVLRKLSAQDHKLQERTGIAGGKFTSRGWSGFNEERWTAWSEAFAAARTGLADAEAKELAGQAVDIMKSK
ncbi:hypothetical protein CMUS01_10181 [Colletotrichum musicola]|uniref:Uncharacterized protein n=1 Tax=Colletotrichum musicola TaxID=2175873 RepID=A0A8H6K565_9PEZI|nr:hypothetical protein CMUS01_10181 [Colletotrichum musicola]